MKNRFIKVLCCLSICSLAFNNTVYANPSDSQTNSVEQSLENVLSPEFLEFSYLGVFKTNSRFYVSFEETKSGFEFVIEVPEVIYNQFQFSYGLSNGLSNYETFQDVYNGTPIEKDVIYSYNDLVDMTSNLDDFKGQLTEYCETMGYSDYIKSEIINPDESVSNESGDKVGNSEESVSSAEQEIVKEELKDSINNSINKSKDNPSDGKTKEYLLAGVVSFSLLLVGYLGFTRYRNYK